jgi:lysophospholipase L1-like esterase
MDSFDGVGDRSASLRFAEEDAMKTVLAYGDSNTWGAATVARPDNRYSYEERWPGVAQAELGSGWRVIEEGLPGRTTVLSDPIEGAHMNGKDYLLPCLRSHRPLDVVVILLGSNDLKARFGLPAQDIATGAGELIKVVKRAEAGVNAGVPAILLVAPPPMLSHTGERPDIGIMFGGGYEKSLLLGSLYAAVAQEHGVAFLDAGAHIRSSAYDGLHFDPDAQVTLGKAIARTVSTLA